MLRENYPNFDKQGVWDKWSTCKICVCGKCVFVCMCVCEYVCAHNTRIVQFVWKWSV